MTTVKFKDACSSHSDDYSQISGGLFEPMTTIIKFQEACSSQLLKKNKEASSSHSDDYGKT